MMLRANYFCGQSAKDTGGYIIMNNSQNKNQNNQQQNGQQNKQQQNGQQNKQENQNKSCR